MLMPIFFYTCKFELLFFDGTVITGKFCVGVPLNNQSIYLSMPVNIFVFIFFSFVNLGNNFPGTKIMS